MRSTTYESDPAPLLASRTVTYCTENEWTPGKVMSASMSFSASSIRAELGELAAQLIGHAAPLHPGVVGQVLHEDRSDGGADHAPLGLAGVRQGVAHEVHSAALPGGLRDQPTVKNAMLSERTNERIVRHSDPPARFRQAEHPW